MESFSRLFTLKMFAAESAWEGTCPRQINCVLACSQAKMKEQVFVIFPEHWKKHSPEHLHKWIGCPLPLLNALHGHNCSGKFPCQGQAKFLEREGFKQATPGHWVKHSPNGCKIRMIHCMDDIPVNSTDTLAPDD